MTIRKLIDGYIIIDEMTRTWGENLEDLNLSEKLWLVRNAIGHMVDWESAQSGLDSAVCEAEQALIFTDEDYKIQVVYAFTKYLTSEYKPLGYYLSGEWAKNAVETWGDHLENIPENDGLILIFNTATDPIDFNDLPNLGGLHECLGEFKNYVEEIQGELIAAIAELAYDQYFA